MTGTVAEASATSVTLYVVGGAVALAVVAGLIGRFLVRRGRREPLVVRAINMVSDRVVEIVKRPITIAVLEEVIEVMRAGKYARNVSYGLEENREQIKAMIAEKIKQDPAAGNISLLPFHDRIIETACETTIRVLLEVLADPRTDELVNDVLRDNLNQIREAVRTQDYKRLAPHSGPDPTSPLYTGEPPPPPP